MRETPLAISSIFANPTNYTNSELIGAAAVVMVFAGPAMLAASLFNIFLLMMCCDRGHNRYRY